MVAVSGNTLVSGRLREHNGNSTEFKFVFKSYSGVVGRTTDLVALMSSLSKMRTRYHGMECCRVQADPDGMWLGQEQEQGARDGERQEQRKGQ